MKIFLFMEGPFSKLNRISDIAHSKLLNIQWRILICSMRVQLLNKRLIYRNIIPNLFQYHLRYYIPFGHYCSHNLMKKTLWFLAVFSHLCQMDRICLVTKYFLIERALSCFINRLQLSQFVQGEKAFPIALRKGYT